MKAINSNSASASSYSPYHAPEGIEDSNSAAQSPITSPVASALNALTPLSLGRGRGKQPHSGDDIVLAVANTNTNTNAEHCRLTEAEAEEAAPSSNQSNQSNAGLFGKLPDALVVDHIFFKLPARDLARNSVVSKPFHQWVNQVNQPTGGAFDQLPWRLTVNEIFSRLPLQDLAATQALASTALASRKCYGWINAMVRDMHPHYGPPRFNNFFEVGEFLFEINQIRQANPRILGHYELIQLHQMLLAGTAPKIHIPTLGRLFRKSPNTRTVDDLIETGLLTCEQTAGVTLDAPQQRYLTSDKVMLALARGVVPNLRALSSISSEYLDGGSLLQPGGIRKAIEAHAAAVIDKMVKSNLFIKISDAYGDTPLHDVVLLAEDQGIQALLALGAIDVINWQNNLGKTPLHIAIRLGKGNIARTLLAHGAAVDKQDQQGDTPLHWVAAKNYPMVEIASACLQAPSASGAINLKNGNGQTALDLALAVASGGEIVQLLRAVGAKTSAELDKLDE